MAGSELPVTVGVLFGPRFPHVHQRQPEGALAVHVIMLLGTATVGLSTLLFSMDIIGPTSWMILIGFGLYAAYVPFGCILFDRLIATVNAVGTAGFLIYVTDAFGYLGSVGLMLYKDIWSPDLSCLRIFSRSPATRRHLLYRTLPGITALLLALTTVRKVAETSIALRVGC